METNNHIRVNVDLKATSSVVIKDLIQYDTNIIDFVILENKNPADMSDIKRIVVNFKRVDGEIIQRILVADNNIVTYEIGNQEMEVSGRGEIELNFYGDNFSRLSTKRFNIFISESLGIQTISEVEQTMMRQLFTEIDDIKSNEEARMQNEIQRIQNEANRQVDTQSAIENANNAAEQALQLTPTVNQLVEQLEDIHTLLGSQSEELLPINSNEYVLVNGVYNGEPIGEHTISYTTDTTWGHIGMTIPNDLSKDYVAVISITNNSNQLYAANARIMLGYGDSKNGAISKNGSILENMGYIDDGGTVHNTVIRFKVDEDASEFAYVTPGFFTSDEGADIVLTQRIYDVTGLSEEEIEDMDWDNPQIGPSLKVGYAEKADVANSIKHKGSKWQGKTWLSLGDSITSPGVYQEIVKDELGFSTVINKAEPGIGMGAMLDDVANEDINSADLITIYGALNHMYPNAPAIGNITDATNGSTFISELKTLIESILTIKPTAKLVIIGTHNAADEYRPDIYQSIRDGKNIGDYVLAMGEVARYYGCPFIDMYGKCGFNAFNLLTYTTDGAHPNTLGYERIAEIIVGELQKIEPIE